MTDQRAHRQLRRMTSQLPAILLSSLFVFVTAGLAASASAVPSREISVETKEGSADGAATSAVQEPPDLIASPALPTSDPGLVPPPSSGTVAKPLDPYMPRGLGEHRHQRIPQAAGLTAHPDRGPPVSGQQ